MFLKGILHKIYENISCVNTIAKDLMLLMSTHIGTILEKNLHVHCENL